MRSKGLRPHVFRLARPGTIVVFALAGLCGTRNGTAQNTPLISGGYGFFTRTSGGNTDYFPYIKPVVLVPIGNHLLVQSRASIAEYFTPKAGVGYTHSTFKTMDYLQADVFAGPHITFVGGEFLTPFGTYNERLTQIWNETLQDFPLIWGAGTMNTGDSVGGMVRGSAYSNRHLNLSYDAYYSGNSTNSYFLAERSSGGQGQIYFPEIGLEAGVSYGRSLGPAHENFEGIDLWWEPVNSPWFAFRSEWARAPHAYGYWFETDYRLSHFGGTDSLLGRVQPVFRMQQTFRNMPDPNDGLPSVNEQEADFGLDYLLSNSVRINTSYARQFSPNGDVNIWETGIVYRLLLPLRKGK